MRLIKIQVIIRKICKVRSDFCLTKVFLNRWTFLYSDGVFKTVNVINIARLPLTYIFVDQ